MAYQIRLPHDPARPVPPAFPPVCACCGRPPETESPLNLSRLVARGGDQQLVAVKLLVPHCTRCARATRSIFLAGCLPFVGGGLLIGLAAFAAGFVLATAYGLDEAASDEAWPSLVVGGGAGLIFGLVGGFVAELVARVLLLPFLGRALLAAPLLAVQFLRDSDYVAGLTGRLAPTGESVELRFDNEDIGREFQRLNPAAQNTR
jgi:hypothetical protein